MSRILIIDDDPAILSGFQRLLSRHGYEVAVVRRAEEGLESLRRDPPDILIMDIRLPGMSGLDALREAQEMRPRLPVILMTGHGTMNTAVEATRRGAFDYQIKPFDPEAMVATIERALAGARLIARPVELDPPEPHESGDALIGQSVAMQEVYKTIGRVAPTDATVLLRGETGTGKELVARAIYQYSRRQDAPLVAVNCTAIPETLLESELFGHERGAFTGAISSRVGRFEQADGGTLFLDEIGDLPASVQAKILRVLQERAFERLGSVRTIKVDVRILAATNRDLEREIAAGRFRDDLYHRLHVVTIHLPPLRARMEDLPRLAAYFLERTARELGVERPILAPDALEVLRGHSWPGNVRELEHAVQRAVIFSHGYPIQAEDIRQALQGVPATPSRSAGPSAGLGAAGEAPGGTVVAGANDGGHGTGGAESELRAIVRARLAGGAEPDLHARLTESLDRVLVVEAMRLARGNQTRAAKLLGLSRPSLQARLQKYGVRAEPEIHEG